MSSMSLGTISFYLDRGDSVWRQHHRISISWRGFLVCVLGCQASSPFGCKVLQAIPTFIRSDTEDRLKRIIIIWGRSLYFGKVTPSAYTSISSFVILFDHFSEKIIGEQMEESIP